MARQIIMPTSGLAPSRMGEAAYAKYIVPMLKERAKAEEDATTALAATQKSADALGKEYATTTVPLLMKQTNEYMQSLPGQYKDLANAQEIRALIEPKVGKLRAETLHEVADASLKNRTDPNRANPSVVINGGDMPQSPPIATPPIDYNLATNLAARSEWGAMRTKAGGPLNRELPYAEQVRRVKAYIEGGGKLPESMGEIKPGSAEENINWQIRDFNERLDADRTRAAAEQNRTNRGDTQALRRLVMPGRR